MFSARMAPARVWQRRSAAAYTKMPELSSCLSPKPDSLNPENESGTSGPGLGLVPSIILRPHTNVRPIKLASYVGKPHRQLESDSCANGDLISI